MLWACGCTLFSVEWLGTSTIHKLFQLGLILISAIFAQCRMRKWVELYYQFRLNLSNTEQCQGEISDKDFVLLNYVEFSLSVAQCCSSCPSAKFRPCLKEAYTHTVYLLGFLGVFCRASACLRTINVTFYWQIKTLFLARWTFDIVSEAKEFIQRSRQQLVSHQTKEP